MPTCSQAEFARLHNVSRKTVTDWKSRGYLTLSGGQVDVEASNARLSAAGRSRLNPATLKPRIVRTLRTGNAGRSAAKHGLSAAARQQHAELYPDVLDLSTLAGPSTAGDIALPLLAHLPPETVRPLVEGILAQIRASAVELADDRQEPPGGLKTWAEHPWFTEPVLPEAEWHELVVEAGGSAAYPPQSVGVIVG